jgi:hypothetical protein
VHRTAKRYDLLVLKNCVFIVVLQELTVDGESETSSLL